MSKQLNTLTADEIEWFLTELEVYKDTVKSFLRSLRNHTIALLMLEAGLRVGEVTNLRVSDLVFNSEPVTSIIITAEISKNGRERQIPVSQRLSTALEKCIGHLWDGILIPGSCAAFFAKEPSSPLSTRMIEYFIQAAAMRKLRRPIHPHVLRHTFASRLMRKTNSRVVQELLGHKNITSTQIYCHPNHEDLTKAINSVDGD